MKKNVIIAIDGYASTGKSTLAKRLAIHLNYTYMDTGYMFRVISFHALKSQWISAQGKIDEHSLEKGLSQMQFSWIETAKNGKLLACNDRVYGEEIRTPEVANLVSQVAALASVRQHLLEQQRRLAKTVNVVMDGRDIGTIVFPQATCKFFLSAKPEIRAQRRFDEMKAKGITATYESILANVIKRDNMDENRAIAPLKKAKDAIAIDTSAMDAAAVFALACHHLNGLL